MNGYLIVGCGSTVYLLKIDAETRMIVVGTSIEFTGCVRCIDARDDIVYVGIEGRGVVVLRYDLVGRGFEEIWNDGSISNVDCMLRMVNGVVAIAGDGMIQGVVQGECVFSIRVETHVVNMSLAERNEERYEIKVGDGGEGLEIGGVWTGASIGGMLFAFCEIHTRV